VWVWPPAPVRWNEAGQTPGASNRTAPGATNDADRSSEPLTSTPKTATPTPTMMSVWTSAMSSRITVFEPTSCHRRNGVADSRLSLGMK